MSSKGPSLRERQIDAVLDLIRRPPFTAYDIGRGYIVVERPPELVPLATSVATEATFSMRFDDEQTARFCRDSKNAEAIVDAVNTLVRK